MTSLTNLIAALPRRMVATLEWCVITTSPFLRCVHSKPDASPIPALCQARLLLTAVSRSQELRVFLSEGLEASILGSDRTPNQESPETLE